MDVKKFKIVFMGTPEFASHSLRQLKEEGINISCVITAPDKAAGRGKKVRKSEVKEYAEQAGLPLLQPTNLKDPAFINDLQSYSADLFVVVAFRMLPEVVFAMPPLGTINLHASLLPDYRGAAPINHAIINGETLSGISTFFIEKEIDTGKIIMQEKVGISDNMDAGMLHDKLMEKGSELLVQTIRKIEKYGPDIKTHPDLLNQAELLDRLGRAPKIAPKIFPEDCEIDWTDSIENTFNFIRGLSPFPGARTKIKDGSENLTDDKTGNSSGKEISVKIFSTKKESGKHKAPVPSLHTDNKTYLKVAVNGGFLHIKELQVPGKKRMAIEDFLRGNSVSGWMH